MPLLYIREDTAGSLGIMLLARSQTNKSKMPEPTFKEENQTKLVVPEISESSAPIDNRTDEPQQPDESTFFTEVTATAPESDSLKSNTDTEKETQSKSFTSPDSRSEKESTGTDELLRSCFVDLPEMVPQKTVELSHLQEKAESAGVAIMAGLGMLILIIVPVEIFCLIRDGFSAHSIQSSLHVYVFLIPMLLLSRPALMMAANRLNQAKRFKLAEFFYRVNMLFAVRTLACPGGLELSRFYLSIGRLSDASNLLSRLRRRVDGNNVDSMIMLQALEAEVLGRLGNKTDSTAATESALELLTCTALDTKTKMRTEGFGCMFVGAALESCGELERSLECYRRALQARVDEGTIEKETLGLLASRIALLTYRLGDADNAAHWIELALATTGNAARQTEIEVLTNAAYFRLYQERLDDSETIATSAQSLAATLKIDPDPGRIQHLFGLLHAKREQFQTAKEQLRVALNSRKRFLPESHPLIEETLVELETSARAAGDEITSREARIQLSSVEISRQSETSQEPLQPLQVRKTNRKRVVYSLLILWGVWTTWSVVWSGFRLASGYDWIYFYGFLTGAFILLVISLRKTHRRKILEKQLSTQPSISTRVSFLQVSDPEWSVEVVIARLAEPFNRDIIVEDGEEFIQGNLVFYSKEQDCQVILEDEIPSYVTLPDGILKLSRKVETAREVLTRRTGKSQASLVVLPALMIIPIIAVCWVSDIKEIPRGLSAFEYYRYAASELDSDWKYRNFSDVDKIKQGFDKAYQVDPNGTIGQLAHRCAQSELPHMVPDQDVWEQFQEAINGRLTAAKAINNMEFCISKAPQFDWAYSELADLLISDKQLDRASKVLEQAAALNPTSMNYLLALAHYQVARGDHPAAVATMKKALEIDPLNTEVYKRLILLELSPSP